MDCMPVRGKYTSNCLLIFSLWNVCQASSTSVKSQSGVFLLISADGGAWAWSRLLFLVVVVVVMYLILNMWSWACSLVSCFAETLFQSMIINVKTWMTDFQRAILIRFIQNLSQVCILGLTPRKLLLGWYYCQYHKECPVAIHTPATWNDFVMSCRVPLLPQKFQWNECDVLGWIIICSMSCKASVCILLILNA